MRFEHQLTQRMEHSLTPQLIQTIRLLQLPIQELELLIEKELQQNPALEQVDDGEAGADTEVAEEMVAEEVKNGEGEGEVEMGNEVVTGKEDGEEVFTGSEEEEFSFGDLMPTDAWDGWGGEWAGTGESGQVSEELLAPSVESLRKWVLPKLMGELSSEDAAVAEQVVEWVDGDGFIKVTPEELAETIGADFLSVRRVLQVLQRIPPGGIGCSGVREALLVQLELAGCPPDALEIRLLTEGWELLTKKQTGKLARRLGVDEEDVRRAVGKILELEPKPGRRFTEKAPEYVLPDFSVEWQGDRLAVVVRDERVPRLRVAQRFLEVLRNPKSYSREQVQFAREKVRAAVMFLRAIESRRRMLKQLVEMVLQEQREFFLNGPEWLKPATLREAAGKLGVHPATVSRAINGKYLETPFGIFPLKSFFRAGTDGRSRESIKERIQAIIAAEDKRSPLSDEEIVARLKGEGVKLSRRTIAKYRAELGIPSSDERRVF